jgi:hypothetical protein
MDAVQVALLKGNQNSEAQGFNSGSGVWKFGKGFSSQDGHALPTFALRLETPRELSQGSSARLRGPKCLGNLAQRFGSACGRPARIGLEKPDSAKPTSRPGDSAIPDASLGRAKAQRRRPSQMAKLQAQGFNPDSARPTSRLGDSAIPDARVGRAKAQRRRPGLRYYPLSGEKFALVPLS